MEESKEKLSLGEVLIIIGSYLNQRDDTSNEVSSTQGNKIMSTKEVITKYPFLKLHKINELIKKNKLEVIKIGRLNYFEENEILKYLEDSKAKPKFGLNLNSNKKYI